MVGKIFLSLINCLLLVSCIRAAEMELGKEIEEAGQEATAVQAALPYPEHLGPLPPPPVQEIEVEKKFVPLKAVPQTEVPRPGPTPPPVSQYEAMPPRSLPPVPKRTPPPRPPRLKKPIAEIETPVTVEQEVSQYETMPQIKRTESVYDLMPPITGEAVERPGAALRKGSFKATTIVQDVAEDSQQASQEIKNLAIAVAPAQKAAVQEIQRDFGDMLDAIQIKTNNELEMATKLKEAEGKAAKVSANIEKIPDTRKSISIKSRLRGLVYRIKANITNAIAELRQKISEVRYDYKMLE